MNTLKTTTAILIIASLATTTMAQKINSAKVPVVVKNAFKKAYPAVTGVKWEKEKGDYEAGFKQDGNVMSALFKADGMQTESEVDIKATSLPASVISYVKQNYKGAVIKEAAKITKAGGEVNYEAEVKGKDLLFDKDGKFLKVAQD